MCRSDGRSMLLHEGRSFQTNRKPVWLFGYLHFVQWGLNAPHTLSVPVRIFLHYSICTSVLKDSFYCGSGHEKYFPCQSNFRHKFSFGESVSKYRV